MDNLKAVSSILNIFWKTEDVGKTNSSIMNSMIIAEHLSARQLIRECSEISTLVCIYIYVVLSCLGMQ